VSLTRTLSVPSGSPRRDGVRSGPRLPVADATTTPATDVLLDQTIHHRRSRHSCDDSSARRAIDEENARRADPTGENALSSLSSGHDGDRTERFGKARADEGVGLAIRGGDRIGGALVFDGELGA